MKARDAAIGLDERYVKALGEVKAAALDGLPSRVPDGARALVARTVDQLTESLALAASLAGEPSEDVVSFKRTIRRSTFSYVALRAPDGWWYVTGEGQSATRYTWYQLLEFIGEDGLRTVETPVGWRSLEVTR